MELDQQKTLRPAHNQLYPANQHMRQHSPGMGDRADYYKQQNLLHQINGLGEIDQIFEQIRAIMASLEA